MDNLITFPLRRSSETDGEAVDLATIAEALLMMSRALAVIAEDLRKLADAQSVDKSLS